MPGRNAPHLAAPGRKPFQSTDLGGDVAQLGEHLVRNEGVGGSNPLISTIFDSARAQPERMALGQAQRNPNL